MLLCPLRAPHQPAPRTVALTQLTPAPPACLAGGGEEALPDATPPRPVGRRPLLSPAALGRLSPASPSSPALGARGGGVLQRAAPLAGRLLGAEQKEAAASRPSPPRQGLDRSHCRAWLTLFRTDVQSNTDFAPTQPGWFTSPSFLL